MDWETRYRRAAARLLADPQVCAENRRLFRKFFAYLEYKLKRSNNLAALDASSFRTLETYVTRLRTVNRWFANRPWVRLTQREIKAVYDGVEDGAITTVRGTPVKDRMTYYSKILRGKPFELAGKAKLVREVMEFYRPAVKEDVRFVPEGELLLVCWFENPFSNPARGNPFPRQPRRRRRPRATAGPLPHFGCHWQLAASAHRATEPATASTVLHSTRLNSRPPPRSLDPSLPRSLRIFALRNSQSPPPSVPSIP